MSDALDLGDTVLIGTFLGDGEPRALVRLRAGQVKTVVVGDRVAGGSVAAIDTDRLMLAFPGQSKALEMPAA